MGWYPVIRTNPTPSHGALKTEKALPGAEHSQLRMGNSQQSNRATVWIDGKESLRIDIFTVEEVMYSGVNYNFPLASKLVRLLRQKVVVQLVGLVVVWYRIFLCTESRHKGRLRPFSFSRETLGERQIFLYQLAVRIM